MSRSTTNRASCSAGLGLIELVVALGLLALLVALATPGLLTLRANALLNSASNQMLVALHLARSAALTRGVTAAVCQSDDLEHCVAREGASSGYIVFVNGVSGRAAAREGGEEILRRYRVPERVTLTGSRSYAVYYPWPRAGTTVTWVFCDAGAAAPTRRVIVSQTGRPRVERDAQPAACAR